MVLLEEVRHDVRLLAEHQLDLDRKVEGMSQKVDGLNQQIGALATTVNGGFSLVMKALADLNRRFDANV